MPPKEDPAKPEFWEKRFREGVTPWDAGRVPAALSEFLKTESRGQRVLIPGCGSSYEARALAETGFDVLAIDYAAAAVERAQQTLGPLAHLVRFADFFEFDANGPFDLIYERAFLCALPRRLWPAYAQRVADLLRPGGQLAGFFFFDDNERGPPFGLKRGELEVLLGGHFEQIANAAVENSIAVFAGREHWQVWRRKPEA